MRRAVLLAAVLAVVAARRWWVANRPVPASWDGWPDTFHPIGRTP